MGAAEPTPNTAGVPEGTEITETLTDLWFTLAMITGVIHLYVAARALRQALTGDGSLLFPIVTLAVVAGMVGVLVAFELDLIPRETVYSLGIGLAGLLLFGYVDATALGIFAPLLGADQAVQGGSLWASLFSQLQGNLLAMTSKVAEIGMLGVLGTLYFDETGFLSMGEQSHSVKSAAQAGRNEQRYEQPVPSQEQLNQNHAQQPAAGQNAQATNAPQQQGRAPVQNAQAPRQQQAAGQQPPAGQAPPAPANAAAAAGGMGHANGVAGGANPNANRGGVAPPNANANVDENATAEEPANDQHFLEQFGQPPSWGLLTMRLSLAMVFIVFGGIKVWPESAAAAVVENTVFFFAHPEFFWVLGVWEFLVGIMLLWKRTLRAAAWLFFFQMAGTLLGLIFFVEGTWKIFPIYPTAVGTYIIKNFIFLGAAMVLVIGYTGSDVREPPIDKLENDLIKDLAMKFHWALSTWVPRHSLTFLRGTVVFLLIAFGIKGMAGLGATGTLENIKLALDEIGVVLPVSTVAIGIGVLKFTSGALLISNSKKLMTYATGVLGVYIGIGLLPMFLRPDLAFYQGWLVAPDFPTLWFLKDTVTLGAVWVIRDVDHTWDLSKAVSAGRDSMQVLLTWFGLDPDEMGADDQPEFAPEEQPSRTR